MFPEANHPDFIIIGVMKGGTTVLYDFITLHPDIERAKEKEIHYFSLNFHKGSDWYLGHFPETSDRLTGEASTTYFHVTNSSLLPNLIKSFNPEVKIILIVRDPIERALSHYNFFCKRWKIPEICALDANEFFSLPFTEAITETNTLGFYLNQALSFSLYYRNFLYYEKVFDKSNILVLSNRNLREYPYETMEKVYKFIGVKPKMSDEFKVKKYSLGTNTDVFNRNTFRRLAGLFYSDFKMFCERTGIEYTEKEPGLANQIQQKVVDLSPDTAEMRNKKSLQISGLAVQDKTEQEDVHIGKDGWLFLLKGTNNSLAYYKNPDLFNEDIINNWINLLQNRIRYFNHNNIGYVHLFVPNKLTIYSEYYDGELPYLLFSPLRKLYRVLIEREKNDILDHLINPINHYDRIKNSHQLYWKTDTHWTFLGVFAAYQLLCAKMNIKPNLDLLKRNRKTVNIVMDEGGKLNPPVREEATFYYLLKDAKRIHANPLVKFKEENTLEDTVGLHTGSNVIFRNDNSLNPETVVLFGDSFSECNPHFLTGALAETFREVHFVWSVSLDFDYIESVEPDIVISENLERFMPRVPTDDFNLKKTCEKKLGNIKV